MTDRLPVLSRPRDGAVVAGVCAGLARRLGIEPKVVRIVAVVSVIALGGLGAALYIAGVLLLPRDTDQVSPLGRALPFTREWPRWAVVAGVIAILVALTWGSGAGPATVPLAIIAVVIWAATRRRGFTAAGPVRPVAVEPTPFERAADAWRVRLAEEQVPGFDAAVSQPLWQQPYTDPSDRLVSDLPVPAPAVPAPRRSWRLWGLALAAVGTFTLAVAVLSVFFGLPGTPVAYASAVLAGLGVTALVATRIGRPPLLVPATAVAALVLCALLAAGQAPIGTSVGDLTASYTTTNQLPTRIDRLAGDVDLDLSALRLTGSKELDIHVRAGDVHLKLPTNAAASVNWEVNAGDVTVNGINEDDTALGHSGGMAMSPNGGQGGLTINVQIDLGDLEVRT